MTPIIISIYALTALLLLLGTLIGYKRGFGRATVRLVYLAIIAVAALLGATSISGTVSTALLELARGFYNDLIIEAVKANPQLEVIVQSLVSALLAPIIFAVLFGFVQLITLICFKSISAKIVALFKKELNPKASKWAGAGVGLVSAVVMIFALFAPITFAASVLANTPTETLELIDAAFLSQEGVQGEQVAYADPYGALNNTRQTQSSGISIKALRDALGVFSILSNDYKIVGSEQSAQREISNLIAAAGDGLASLNVSIENNPEDSATAYLNVIAAVGANAKHSSLISTVVRETAKAISNMDTEAVTKALGSVTPNAEAIAAFVPEFAPVFEELANATNEEVADTFSFWFGDPIIEPSRTKENREKEGLTDTIAPDTSAPVVTDAPVVTEAPEVTDAPESTEIPDDETTATDETTAPPEETTTQGAMQNNGIISAFINDGNVSHRGEEIAEDVVLFNTIKKTARNLLASNFDIYSEKYSWVFELIQSELYNLLCAVEADPTMTYVEQIHFFEAALEVSIRAHLSPEAYNTAGVNLLLKPASLQVVSVYTIKEFTPEEYPDKVVPIKDIMIFMGYDEAYLPAWVISE